jgi:hypothetical protein
MDEILIIVSLSKTPERIMLLLAIFSLILKSAFQDLTIPSLYAVMLAETFNLQTHAAVVNENLTPVTDRFVPRLTGWG